MKLDGYWKVETIMKANINCKVWEINNYLSLSEEVDRYWFYNEFMKKIVNFVDEKFFSGY